MNITTLLQKGNAHIASLPPENWQEADANISLTVPLIAEDYPAKTAVMWNAAYTKFGFPDRNMMLVADPKDLATIVQALHEDGRYVGGGAGVGFKVEIIPFLDDCTSLAKVMGAVNIIKKIGGRLIGDNTDGEGYVESLEDALAPLGKSLAEANILMLGAGGSGRAIAFALAKKGARLTILNRTEAKALELAETINWFFGTTFVVGGGREKMLSMLADVDAVVSVIDDAVSPLDAYSTIGDMEFPVTPASIAQNLKTTKQLLENVSRSVVISDIRIRKGPTVMLMQAKELGFRTLDGLPMVVNQGAVAFWWLYGEQLAARGITHANVKEVMRTAAGLA